MAITIIAVSGLPYLGHLNQLIFLNRTNSMPLGFYVRYSSNKLKIGDIIVFNLNDIKYIAAHEGDDICVDSASTLWVNSLSVAQINIEKYPEKIPEQSSCQRLKKDEFLVLGDHQDSYDSRYFGPIKTHDVISPVKPLWLFQ
jgi:signal peptidase I